MSLTVGSGNYNTTTTSALSNIGCSLFAVSLVILSVIFA
jgi:hypothetical protein